MNMYKWFALLSKKQRSEMLAIILIIAIILGVGVVTNLPKEKTVAETFVTDMSISDIAPKLEVTGKALARELDLQLDAPKKKSLSSMGITEETLQHSVEHLLSHRDSMLKYYVYIALFAWGLVFLVRLGRPDGSDIKNRHDWYPRTPYIISLLLSVAIAGFLLGKSPNPMESIVKVFKSMIGLYPDPMVKIVAFVFFIILAIVGNKIICGWACPFGALQELIYSMPILRKIKEKKLPFVLTNTIRACLFITTFLFLFGIIGGRKGFVIYHYVNPFNLFNLDFETLSLLLTVIITLLVSLVFYRPFCQLICPFGLISWIAEKFSIFRVKIDKEKCTQCGACIKACPLKAAEDRVKGKKMPADCFSCARCLNVCPVDAIRYTFFLKKNIK